MEFRVEKTIKSIVNATVLSNARNYAVKTHNAPQEDMELYLSFLFGYIYRGTFCALRDKSLKWREGYLCLPSNLPHVN